jgi:hypothetical protein
MSIEAVENLMMETAEAQEYENVRIIILRSLKDELRRKHYCGFCFIWLKLITIFSHRKFLV